jgi:hypothetical protein
MKFLHVIPLLRIIPVVQSFEATISYLACTVIVGETLAEVGQMLEYPEARKALLSSVILPQVENTIKGIHL